jgi:signal transduction histidine kinase
MGWCGWLILGAAVGAALAGLVVLRVTRRVFRDARRLRRRAHGQEHFAEIGKLVGGLAHEIKNPLSTINLNLKLLTEDLAEYHDENHVRLRRRLLRVGEEADRLRSILDDFMRFTGKVELQLQRVDLRELVSELADFFAPQADAARVVLRTSFPDQPVPCRVDPNLIKQAVLNLLINAVQAMAEGGELMVHVRRDGKSGIIEVVDTGPGMPPNVREKVFDIYYSTKKGGSGLGLPTTLRIVHEHAARLHLETEPGCGTKFSIILPLAEEA